MTRPLPTPGGLDQPPGRCAPPAAGWVRFGRYELRDGVVRPAAGARPEPYDPWAAYRAARAGWGGRGGRAPYESLLALVWSVRLRPGRPGHAAHPDPAGERAILAWCAAHGLLGLLPHEAEVAFLAPRWAAAPTPGGRLAVVARGYGHDYRDWEALAETWQPPVTPPSAWVGELVPPALWPALWGPPAVHGRRLGDGAWTTRPLGAAWGPYFPGVPADERDTHAYPRPLSPAFWGAYAEPLGHFLSAAALFADAVGALGAARRGGTGHAGAERAFASLAAGVQATLGVGPGGRERAWRTKSLLGAFAVMAYLDLAAGWRVVGCGVCGAPFAAGGYQTLYCSARCRNTAVKRAYRRRLRGRAARAHSPGLAR